MSGDHKQNKEITKFYKTWGIKTDTVFPFPGIIVFTHIIFSIKRKKVNFKVFYSLQVSLFIETITGC